jgi:hypothetical protein
MKRESTRDRWYNFIKYKWDLHWKCDHDNGYDESNYCDLPEPWRWRDPDLLELYVQEREVGPWLPYEDTTTTDA